MSKHRSFRGLSWIAALVATAAAAGGCSSSSTSILVQITVDSALLPTVITRISGSIEAPNRSAAADLHAQTYQEWQITPQNVTSEFDATITIVGESAADAATQEVVTAKAYVHVKPGHRQLVPIELSPQCKGVSCPAEQTCSAGLCIPIPQFGGDAGASGQTGGQAGGGRVGSGGGAAGRAGAGGSAGGGAGGRAGAAGGSAGAGGDAGSGTGGAAQGGSGGKAKLDPGAACTATADCASGVCSTADHVCCDTNCTGLCESCVGSKTGKANGVCNPLPAGSNADNDCSPGTTTCGATGSCDGNRACALAAATTPCTGSASCTGGQLTVTPAACDGKGTCAPGTQSVAACPGGVACMSATACLPASCTSDAGCLAASFCDPVAHTCSTKHDLGGACSGTNQCASGFCVDGVCCSNGCKGTCEACVKTKTGVADGHCAAVTAGTDPDNECSADGTACGHTGVCDHNGGSGAGACAYTASTTSCPGTFSCTGSGTTSSTTGACDGAGTCKQSSASAATCGGYLCTSTTACATACTATSGCAAGHVCSGGSCVASAFTTGPCVVTADFVTPTVFALGNDGHIHTRTAPSGTWGPWATLSVDASVVDARSDLDCSANTTVTHIVATGTTPLGALMHATGSGTTFNPFFRELAPEVFSLGASVWSYPVSGNNYVVGALDVNPIYYDVYNGTYTQITPLTNRVNSFAGSPIDVAQESFGGGANRILVGFDSSNALAVYTNTISSAPAEWDNPPELISAPAGTGYQYSPTICLDTQSTGNHVVTVAAVAGNGQVWVSQVDSIFNAFPAWTKIGTGAAGAVDCTMFSDESVHVVTINASGHVLDIHGAGTSWTTTDLGVF